MPRKRRSKLKLNDIESLTFLMQETYNDACGQQHEAQKAINELVNGAEPQDVEDITKIAREKANFLKIKDSAIRVKLELSKLKSDFIKNSSNPDNQSAGDTSKPTFDDFSKVRQLMKEKNNNDDDGFEV